MAAGFENDVPHFNHQGHYQTQSNIERSRHKARRKRDVRLDELEQEGRGGSTLFNFVWVSGMFVGIFAVGGLLSGQSRGPRRQKEGNGGPSEANV